MIRGLGDVMSSTYSQTFNGYGVAVSLVNCGVNASSKWAIF
uniref:Uncharacterized protein n=1 Tax=Caenorhabditis japonica TaxID=281687 RepID=A0A8R1EK82_CAEJA